MQINDLRKLRRFKEIVTILAKYGFDDLARHLALPGSALLRKIHPPPRGLASSERVRAAIEALGPTFIKFGQVMSLRPDLLPPYILAELEKLQDNVPAIDCQLVTATVEECLGKPIKAVFSAFDIQPIAAASLAQVHRGVLLNLGDLVAIKVQRPGIAKNIKLDLAILEGIASYLDHRFVDLHHYTLPELVKVIRQTMMKELDFTQELQNMEIARSYSAEQDLYIPKTYRAVSNERLLVMEYIQGTKFKELATASGYDRQMIATMGLKTAVKQILADGFFHADPHPGNLLLKPDMTLCLIDWGMVGRLTEHNRFLLIDLLKSVVEKDSNALLQSFLRLCDTRGELMDPGTLENELLDLLDNYYAFPIKDLNAGQFLMSLTEIIRIHHLQLPRDVMLMIKALVTAEGSARLIYPELDIISEIRAYVHKLALQRYRPAVLWRHLRNSLAGLWFSQRQLPYQLGQVITKLEHGKLGFSFHLEKLSELIRTLETASNRLTAGIVTGAIIIGSSMIITTGIGPYLFGFPALGVIGYLLSVILGIYLLYTILHHKK